MKTNNSLVLLFCVLVILAIIACGGSPEPAYEEPVYEEPQEPAQPEAPAEEGGSAEKAEADFNPSNANQVPPEDVLGEVTYYGGGGRGSACEWATTPTLVILSALSSTPQEWMDSIDFDSCGWQSDETVTVTVIFPDSSQVSEVVATGSYGMFPYEIKATRSMQPGEYTIIVEGASGYVEDTTTVIVPSSPRMYGIEENQLFLYNFSPYENIRLFAYEPGASDTMRLIGWNQYQADATGQLQIQTPGNQQYVYYAIGETSGLVENLASPSNNLILGFGSDILISDCGGLPSRLFVDAGARVTFTDGSDMSIREKPGFSENVLTTVPENSAIVILNSRKCAEGSTWWKILTDDGQEGWMAEDQNGVYLLEPYP